MNYLKPPILFTFRRCPYAMRARLALWSSQTKVEIRVFWIHPIEFLAQVQMVSIKFFYINTQLTNDK